MFPFRINYFYTEAHLATLLQVEFPGGTLTQTELLFTACGLSHSFNFLLDIPREKGVPLNIPKHNDYITKSLA